MKMNNEDHFLNLMEDTLTLAKNAKPRKSFYLQDPWSFASFIEGKPDFIILGSTEISHGRDTENDSFDLSLLSVDKEEMVQEESYAGASLLALTSCDPESVTAITRDRVLRVTNFSLDLRLNRSYALELSIQEHFEGIVTQGAYAAVSLSTQKLIRIDLRTGRQMESYSVPSGITPFFDLNGQLCFYHKGEIRMCSNGATQTICTINLLDPARIAAQFDQATFFIGTNKDIYAIGLF